MGLLSRQPSHVRAIKTRLYELIDRATSEYLSAPNHALNIDVTAAINGAPDAGYAATKACKRIKGRLVLKNPRVQQLALQLLEHCVRSCGEVFHRELAKSELFVELLHMADRTSWCTAQLQTQVLALLQEWAYNLKPAQYLNAYNKLMARGLPFPPRTGAPTFEPYPGLSPPPPHAAGSGHLQPHHSGPPPAAAAGPVGPPQLLAPGQPAAKLREDLGVARNTVSLLQEMLDGVPPDNCGAAKEEYVMDMVAQCREMKDRLARLIGRLDDESLLGEALGLNDDAQAALDRHADMVAVAEGRRRRPPPRQKEQQQPAAAAAPREAAAAAARPAAAPPAAPAASKPAPPLLDLLSLDVPGPSEPTPPVAAATPSAAADPFALSSAAPARMASNNPFAPPVPAPGPAAPAAATAPAAPAAAPAAAPRPPAAESNPFLNDSMFAAAAGGAPSPAGVARTASAASEGGGGSGNPFAAPLASPARPPPASPVPLQPAPAQASPYGGSAYPPAPTQPAYQPPPPTYSSSPFGPPGTSPPPITPGPYGRPLSDHFGDLVAGMKAKDEPPPPPPPRGTPMRSPTGLTPEPSSSAVAASQPTAAASSEDANKAALSAFDAFDELVGTRSPSRTTSAT